MNNGWDESAQPWIDSLGTNGDWGRRFVLDAPMLGRVRGRGFADALDLGCGEGRFCRMMNALGIRTTGIDPAAALIDRARALDPAGDYRVQRAEALAMRDATFDLAVCYLTLIDIDDLAGAIAEAWRVLRPGGTFLIANLQAFDTAGIGSNPPGDVNYFEARSRWVAWRGIRVRNWHRPLATYVQAMLDHGFELRYFVEPEPSIDDAKARRYRSAPHFLVMEWQKPRIGPREVPLPG